MLPAASGNPITGNQLQYHRINGTKSNVEDMERMFYYARSFNQPLNKWNVSNVTDMNDVFLGETSFNQPLNK